MEESEEVEEDGNVRHVLSARNVRSDDRGLGPINVLGLRRRIRRDAAARRARAAGRTSSSSSTLVLPPPPSVSAWP